MDWREQVLFLMGPRLCKETATFEALQVTLSKCDELGSDEVCRRVELLVRKASVFSEDALPLVYEGLGILSPSAAIRRNFSLGNDFPISSHALSHGIPLDLSDYSEAFSSRVNEYGPIDLYTLIKKRRFSLEEAQRRRNTHILLRNREQLAKLNPRSAPFPWDFGGVVCDQGTLQETGGHCKYELDSSHVRVIGRLDRLPRHVTSIFAHFSRDRTGDESILSYVPRVNIASQHTKLLENVSLPRDFPLITTVNEEIVEELSFEVISHFGPCDFVLTQLANEFNLTIDLITRSCFAKSLRACPRNVNTDNPFRTPYTRDGDHLLVSFRYFFCSVCKVFMCGRHQCSQPTKRARTDVDIHSSRGQQAEGATDRPQVGSPSDERIERTAVNAEDPDKPDHSATGSPKHALEFANDTPKSENDEVEDEEFIATNAAFETLSYRIFPDDPIRAKAFRDCVVSPTLSSETLCSFFSLIKDDAALESAPLRITAETTYDRRLRLPRLRTPCEHVGPCEESNCPCVSAKRHCQEDCGCEYSTCKNTFSGCSCKIQASSSLANGETECCYSRKQCVCVFHGFECDPSKCACCRSPHPASSSVEPRAVKCQNSNVTRGERGPKLVVGCSSIHIGGLGVFAGEDIAKKAFIGEYVGDIITSDEGNARGFVYDRINKVTFLFGLCQSRDVDSLRLGNKTKWMNRAPPMRFFDDEDDESSVSSTSTAPPPTRLADRRNSPDVKSDAVNPAENVPDMISTPAIGPDDQDDQEPPFMSSKTFLDSKAKYGPKNKSKKQQGKKKKKRQRTVVLKPPKPSMDQLLAERRRAQTEGRPVRANVTAKCITVRGEPHLLFFANVNIKKGDELCFDYNGRKVAVQPRFAND